MLPVAYLPRRIFSILVAVCVLGAAACVAAQAQGASLGGLGPQQWAQQAANGELHDLEFQGEYLRYRSRVIDSKGDQTREVIESKDGTVARLILRDGRALTADEDQAERERLADMASSPEAFARHTHSDQEGKKNAADVLRLMPDAMLFSFAPGQPQRQSLPAGNAAEVVIDFEPKPQWKPPTMFAEALTGIHGRFWVDSTTHHLMRLEASVVEPINVGFGVYAKVFPGGTIALEQAHVRDRRWIYSHFTKHLTVRILMVRTLHQDGDVRSGNFVAIDPISYQEAIKLLLATPLPTH